MVDWVVLLTPLLVLAVVLLLGFAGCHRVFPLDPLVTPLTLRARVPMALTVREIVFTWEPPSIAGGQKSYIKPERTGFDGDDNLFDHALTGERENGGWRAACRVKVAGGTAQGVEAIGDFVLDGSLTTPVATFQATGPAAKLAVGYVGLKGA